MTDQLRPQATFAVVPTWVLDHEALSDRAVRLYAVLARYADAEGKAWPARPTLANRLRCSADTIDRAVRELVAAGALTVQRRQRPDGAPTSNLYRLQVTPPAEGVAAPVRPPSRTAAARVAAPVRTERKPVEREPENESQVLLVTAAAATQGQPPERVSSELQLPTRPQPGRTLTSQLVSWGRDRGHVRPEQLAGCTDRIDVHRLALRLAEQHTEGAQATRVAHHLAAEYLGVALGGDASAVTPGANRLLARLVAVTTPASLLRYLDLAVQAGAGLRDEDEDEALAVVKYASAVHRRERAEAARPAAR